MITRTLQLLPFVEYNIYIREAKGNVPDLSDVGVFSGDNFPKGMHADFQVLWTDPTQNPNDGPRRLLDFPSFTGYGLIDPVVKLKFSEFISRFDGRYDQNEKVTVNVSRDSELDFEVYAIPSCVTYR